MIYNFEELRNVAKEKLTAFYLARAELRNAEQELRNAQFDASVTMNDSGSIAAHIHNELAQQEPEVPDEEVVEGPPEAQ